MSTSTSPAQATGSPRAMAEQDILKIIWPPDGRVPWEERRKVPEIERTIGHLLDVLETGGNYMSPPKSPAESYHVTQKIIALKASGYTEVQIAEMTGLTKDAVHNRIGRYRQKQQTTKAQGMPTPDQSVEVNKMIAGSDSTEAKPSANVADHIVEANEMVADTDATLRNVAQVGQAQPEIEQVARPAAALQEEAKPAETPTIRKDRMVEESKEVRPGGAKPEKVPLTDEQKAQILKLHAKGVSNHEIAAQLGIKDARQVQGTVIARRKTAENVGPAATNADALTQKPAKDVMLLQQSKAEDKAPELQTAAPKSAEGKPAPKAMTRAETDKKMWDLWKSGKSPKEIADILWDEQLYYSEKSVSVRLRSQGADI